MEKIRNFLFRFTRLFWMPKRRYASLCQRSGFYSARKSA